MRSMHPEVFQGRLDGRNYFEGWYFKFIDPERRHAVAVIPGISLGAGKGDSHSFIQYIDAVSAEVSYFKFPLESFKAATDRFEVEIGPNRFSREGVSLKLEGDGRKLSGEFRFDEIISFPERRPFPGIMGPFTFVPRMECYHGVVNIRHRIEGQMSANGAITDFTGGEGYIEKDWGRSFPDAWIWLQANHFEKPASFMLSFASIPWMGGHFPGLISFLMTEGRMRLFATYNLARMSELELGETSLRAVIRKCGEVLEVNASYDKAGELAAPKNGLMVRTIKESITATTRVRLSSVGGEVLFEGESGSAGLEISGDVRKYMRRGR